MVIATTFEGALSRYDVCVVGSGPAGLAVALECERRGRTVLLLDAGGSMPDRRADAAFVDRIANERAHVPLQVATRQGFGGTSWAWGGLCVPLDEIDFERRDYLPMSGWPIRAEALAGWHAAAAEFLGCGAPDFTAADLLADPEAGLHAMMNGRIPLQPKLAAIHQKQVARSPRIHCCLNVRVIDLALTADGRVDRLQFDSDRPLGPVPAATRYVLAAGGVESTRILLATQRRHPGLAGGPAGALGRFYMGHIAGQLATLVFREKLVAAKFLYHRDGAAGFLQRRFTIGPEAQRRHRLLNMAYILRLPPAADSRHLSGSLSLLHLMLRLSPRLKVMSRSLKLQSVIPQLDLPLDRGHLRNILTGPAGMVGDAVHVLRALRFRHTPLIFSNPGNRYSLRYHCEQIPNPDSRISLLGETGTAGLVIDRRYSCEDITSVIRAHEITDSALRKAGIGHLDHNYPEAERACQVERQAIDGYHQIGTTRMGSDPRTSVVDSDCRVHGMRNLFVASSSTFPTSGAANPTFSIVCLAMRLADHLARLPA